MNFVTTTASGFCFGIGLVLALVVVRLLFHVGFCG